MPHPHTFHAPSMRTLWLATVALAATCASFTEAYYRNGVNFPDHSGPGAIDDTYFVFRGDACGADTEEEPCPAFNTMFKYGNNKISKDYTEIRYVDIEELDADGVPIKRVSALPKEWTGHSGKIYSQGNGSDAVFFRFNTSLECDPQKLPGCEATTLHVDNTVRNYEFIFEREGNFTSTSSSYYGHWFVSVAYIETSYTVVNWPFDSDAHSLRFSVAVYPRYPHPDLDKGKNHGYEIWGRQRDTWWLFEQDFSKSAMSGNDSVPTDYASSWHPGVRFHPTHALARVSARAPVGLSPNSVSFTFYSQFRVGAGCASLSPSHAALAVVLLVSGVSGVRWD